MCIMQHCQRSEYSHGVSQEQCSKRETILLAGETHQRPGRRCVSLISSKGTYRQIRGAMRIRSSPTQSLPLLPPGVDMSIKTTRFGIMLQPACSRAEKSISDAPGILFRRRLLDRLDVACFSSIFSFSPFKSD
ncbi:hypothetical protein CERSUDRAFT_114633 [Gelatoporia subvermispora B]|uniref:Uncharacterized protein n=1 Tax=Ceriporiopsis subvermispora (strain B) TaxID=914234 RepID=M2QX12_CERS8|nr:hypothetical protein CERSUDRAFT_114633 [Gelatoporia subvermispora B]